MGKGGRKGERICLELGAQAGVQLSLNNRQATQRKERKLIRCWRGGNIRAASASSVTTSTTTHCYD